MHRRNRKSTDYYTNTINNCTKNNFKASDYKQNMDGETSRVKEEDGCKRRMGRLQLGQIVNNNIYPILNDQEMSFSTKIAQLTGGQKSYYPHFRPKLKQNYTKNKQKTKKIQQYSTSFYYPKSMKPTPIKNNQNQQPSQFIYSFNQDNNNILNKFTARCNLLLQINDNNNMKNDNKSKSRALMNYSKVFKNQSKDRFKVKTNKSLIVRFMELSAHKVILAQKYKQSKNNSSNRGKSQVISRHFNDNPAKYKSQNRYAQSQQFDIQAWDYN